MTWYRVSGDSIPAWMPRRVFADMTFKPRRAIRIGPPPLPGWRCVGFVSHMDASVWVPRIWYWYAVAELFLLGLVTSVATFLAEHRVISGADGCFLWELRFNHPAQWSWR